MQNHKHKETIPAINSDSEKADNAFEKIASLPALHQVLTMTLTQTAQSLVVRFPVCHQVSQGHLNDTVDGLTPRSFFKEPSKKKEFNSFLELSFSPNGEWYCLSIACRAYTDYLKYPLTKLLNLINPSSYALHSVVQNRRLSMGSLALKCVTITMPEDIKLNKGQLDIFLQALSRHEGEGFEKDLWIAKGSIERLTQALIEQDPYAQFTSLNS